MIISTKTISAVVVAVVIGSDLMWSPVYRALPELIPVGIGITCVMGIMVRKTLDYIFEKLAEGDPVYPGITITCLKLFATVYIAVRLTGRYVSGLLAVDIMAALITAAISLAPAYRKNKLTQ